MKSCTKCHVERPFSMFSPRIDRPGKYLSRCKICDNLASKDWYQRNGERKREKAKADWHRGKRYGLTKEQVEQMYQKQNNRCAWCGTHESELSQPLCIDHCHETGVVRRLLCFDCNVSEGRLMKMWPEGLRLLNDNAYYKEEENGSST